MATAKGDTIRDRNLLSFGDVVQFYFGSKPCLAMVIAVKGNEVWSDEGTIVLGSDNDTALVLGLTEGDIGEPWHQFGKTASLHISDGVEIVEWGDEL